MLSHLLLLQIQIEIVKSMALEKHNDLTSVMVYHEINFKAQKKMDREAERRKNEGNRTGRGTKRRIRQDRGKE